MSFLWVIRAINLLIILPRDSPPLSPYNAFADLLYDTVILAYFDSGRAAPAKHSTPTHLASAIHFDRCIAAISLFTDASANALVAMSPTSSQPLFVLLTSLAALTSGGLPALQSLGAVSLRAMGKGNEIGLVFGALGLANAMSHIVAVCLPYPHWIRASRKPVDFDFSCCRSLEHTQQFTARPWKPFRRPCSS
jgi:hypothetical protein